MKILIISPRLGEFTPRTVKLNAHTSYLYSFLRSRGVDPLLRDCNWKGVNTIDALDEAMDLNVEAIVIICNNTLLYGNRFKLIVDRCKVLRAKKQISNIWFTGYMATSFYSDFINYAPDAGGICDASGVLWLPKDMEEGLALGSLIVEHACLDGNHPGITWLGDQIKLSSDDRLSLLSSRSCNAKCSFCAYNNGQGSKWEPRPIANVVRDIRFGVQQLQINKVTFSDNDFFGNKKIALMRMEELYRALDQEDIRINFSINARSECLSLDTLRIAKELGLTNITIGLESFHSQTLSGIYFKKINYQHLNEMISEADEQGIHLLLSYILWQPYLTMEQLKFEIEKLIEIGRWRIPQLLVNSVVKVVPTTSIESKMARDGVIQKGLFKRDWNFIHDDVKQVYGDLQQWHKEREAPIKEVVKQRDVNKMTRLLVETKILELEYLIDRLGMETGLLQ